MWSICDFQTISGYRKHFLSTSITITLPFLSPLTLLHSSCYPIPSHSEGKPIYILVLVFRSLPVSMTTLLSPPFSCSGSFIPHCFALLLYSWPSSSFSFSFSLYSVCFVCLTLISLTNWCARCCGTQRLKVWTVGKRDRWCSGHVLKHLYLHTWCSLCVKW